MQNKCAIEALKTNWKIYILETFAMIRYNLSKARILYDYIISSYTYRFTTLKM